MLINGKSGNNTIKMTIAYYIASPTWGGGEQYVYNLARTLKTDYNITPVFIFPADSDSSMVNRFCEVGECPTFHFASKFWRFSRYAGKQLAKLLDQYQVDILHLNSRQSYFLGAWAKRNTKKPIRLIVAQHLVRQAKNTYWWRWAYRQIDTLICTSECVQREYLCELPLTVFKNVVMVHNSVPMMKKEMPTYTATTPATIFYHGRICREKGVFELIKSLESLQDLSFRLVLAGSVDKRDEKAWNMALKSSPIRERITCLGFRTDINQLIPQFTIGVIPTIVPEAGGPLALLENMALGLPTITSNNGSQPEFIRDRQNGRLCPPGDIVAWSDAIRELLTNLDNASQLAEEAQKDFFLDFNYEQFINKMIQIYQSR